MRSIEGLARETRAGHAAGPAPGGRARRAGAWARGAWPLALLGALVVAAYGPAVPAFFTSDDLDMLSGDASDLFSPASGFGRFMPLAASVHRGVARLTGLDPVPPHALQLGLHLASVALVYALAGRLAAHRPSAGRGAPRTVALLAALLFALYPRHHQVVMWFGAVSIGLATTLTLATTLLVLRALTTGAGRWGWLAAGTYGAALLAHESAVTLPLLIGALAVYVRGGRGWPVGGPAASARGLRARYFSPQARHRTRAEPATAGAQAPRGLPGWAWAMAALSLTHLGVLAWAYRVRAALHPESGYRFVGLGADLLIAPLRYAAQLVAPPPWTEPLALGPAGLVLGALALVGAGAWVRRAGPLGRLGLVWGGVAALPFLLFGVYGITDRYYYLPGVGLALALGAALAGWRRLGPALGAAYAAASVLLLAQAAGEWRAAGATTHATLDYLTRWAASAVPARPEAVAFVGAPFKRDTRWPGSQVYVWSTGLAGAAHLATGWRGLRVAYLFADEYPTLAAWLATRPPAPGPPGLYLFVLDGTAPVDRTAVLGSALPELARLRWRGASRTPIEWTRYMPGS